MNRIISSALLLALLSACVATTHNRGYNSEKMQTNSSAIKPGVANINTVKNVLGSPSVTSSYGNKTWYYVSTKTESTAFLEPKIVDQNVIAIAFNDQNIVTDVKKYTREDMRLIELRKDVTRTEGNDLTVLQQLLGNVGRFNPAGGIPGAPSTIGTGL